MSSRVSMLSGRYPSNLGITDMGVPVPEDLPTLATKLGGVGYHCANIGKLHFLPHANRHHREPHPAYDFDHLQVSEEPGVYDDAYASWMQARHPSAPPPPFAPIPPARAAWEALLSDAEPTPGRDDYAVPRPGRVQGRMLLGPDGAEPARQEAANALTKGSGWKSLRTPSHRYLVEADGAESLWDLEADPAGSHDIAAESAQPTLSDCRRQLIEKLFRIERPLDRTFPY